MLITLAGLAVAVATTATVAAYTLAGDGSSAPTAESAGTQEPAFQDGKSPTFDPRLDTIDDGKGTVSVTNPDIEVDDSPRHFMATRPHQWDAPYRLTMARMFPPLSLSSSRSSTAKGPGK